MVNRPQSDTVLLAEPGDGLSHTPAGCGASRRILDHWTQWFAIALHLEIFPGLALMLLILAFNFLGDGLRDWMDPRHRRGR